MHAVLSKLAADCLYRGAEHVPVLVLGDLVNVCKDDLCDLHIVHRDAVDDKACHLGPELLDVGYNLFLRKVKSHTQRLLELLQDVPRRRPVGAGNFGRDKLGEGVLVNALNIAILCGVAIDDDGDTRDSTFFGSNHHLADQVIAISFGPSIDDGGRDHVVVGQVLRRIHLQV